MTRPVFIAAQAMLCARGLDLCRIEAALWAGETGHAQRSLPDAEWPYFALPLPPAENWLARAESACRQLRAALRGHAPGMTATTPLFVASSSFQIGDFESRPGDVGLPRPCASFAHQMADWLGLDGACHSFSNACTSGLSALDAARTLIAAGLIDDALVVGIELDNRSTLAGFASLQLLSPTAGRPFDAHRDGLVLGEAVAAVYLSAEPAPWRIAGLACGLDAHSATGPAPDGARIARVAVDALQQAKIPASAIGLVKLQAAGSPGTDLAEGRALCQVFQAPLPPLLSLKPFLGHTLGASGIAELVALLACLDAGRIPATPGFAAIDPEIGLAPTCEPRVTPVDQALLQWIGFGGGLASLVIARP